jgi:hypothetical protein
LVLFYCCVAAAEGIVGVRGGGGGSEQDGAREVEMAGAGGTGGNFGLLIAISQLFPNSPLSPGTIFSVQFHTFSIFKVFYFSLAH